LDYPKTYVRFVIPMHTSTNGQTLVKIASVVVVIFGEIGWFLQSHPKRCICYPSNLWSYWTHFHPTCTECTQNIAVIHFWIGMEILQSVLKCCSA